MLPIGGLGCCGGHVPMGAEPSQESSVSGSGSGTTWVTGGLLIGLAILVFAIDKKAPLGSVLAR
jgi:hypothetical protein